MDNSDCDMIDVNVLDNDSGWKGVSDLTLEGNKANQASGHGIHVYKTGTGDIFDSRFRNVFVYQAKEKGFNLDGVWGCYVDNCLAEYCDDDGLYFNAAESYVYGFHSSGNGGTGIYIRGTQLALTGLRIHTNAKDGLRMENVTFSAINNAYIDGWGTAAIYTYYGLNSDGGCNHNDISNVNIVGDSNTATFRGIAIYGGYSTFTNITVKDVRNEPVNFPSVGCYVQYFNELHSACGDGNW